MVGSLGHLTDVFARLLAPDVGEASSLIVMAPAAIAEISFIVWLAVKGARPPRSQATAPWPAHSGID
jgi:hypothetical protein